jgi:2-keto-3-deoxy-L-rhamnonate aldolase RhmA
MNLPPPTILRDRLDGPVIGTFLKSPSYHNTEILGHAGLDYIVVDGEHAPFGPAELDMIAMAARSVDLPILMRIATLDAAAINTCLDLGAQGIMVPHVRSQADAERAVAATRHGPGRGFSPSTRAGDYGTLGARACRAMAAAGTTVWAQIEDEEALASLDAIAAVIGVDCLFVGRADLAISLGVEDPANPAMLDALHRVANAARRANRAAGIFVNTIDEIAALKTIGYTCFVCGSDQSLLMEQGKRLRAKIDTMRPMAATA